MKNMHIILIYTTNYACRNQSESFSPHACTQQTVNQEQETVHIHKHVPSVAAVLQGARSAGGELVTFRTNTNRFIFSPPIPNEPTLRVSSTANVS